MSARGKQLINLQGECVCVCVCVFVYVDVGQKIGTKNGTLVIKWKQRLKPAVLWFHFDPYPCVSGN